MLNAGDIVLRGKTFVLRPINSGDEESLVKHANNRKVWLTSPDNFPHPYTLKDAQEWISINRDPEQRKRHFAIEVDGQLCGCIGFETFKQPYHTRFEIGYWLGEQYWGKGITTDAIHLLIKHLFKTYPHCERVVAKVFEGNAASVRVLEKNGFSYEGLLRHNTFKEGKPVNERVYSLLREEFEDAQSQFTKQ